MERILFDENRVAKLIQRISLALSTPSQEIQADEAEDRQETGQIRSFWELTSGRHSCADGDDDSDLDLVCPSPEGERDLRHIYSVCFQNCTKPARRSTVVKSS